MVSIYSLRFGEVRPSRRNVNRNITRSFPPSPLTKHNSALFEYRFFNRVMIKNANFLTKKAKRKCIYLLVHRSFQNSQLNRGRCFLLLQKNHHRSRLTELIRNRLHHLQLDLLHRGSPARWKLMARAKSSSFTITHTDDILLTIGTVG